MTEGQGSGSGAPERDSAWQPVPGAAEDPGPAPDSGTGPGADDDTTPPGASWLPGFAVTTPPDDAAQPAAGTQPAPTASPGSPGTAGPQPSYGQPVPGVPPSYGTQPPPAGYPAPPPAYSTAPLHGAQQGPPPYGGQPGQPFHGTQPLPGEQPFAGQPYPGQPYGSQPYGSQPYEGQPYGGQPYEGQPFGGQPYGAGQPPYGTPPPGGQPQANWQPEPVPVLPLPAELSGAVPPGGEGHWAPPGSGYGQPPMAPPPSRGPLSRALVYLVVAVLAAAVGAGAVLALRGSAGQAPAASSQSIPKPQKNHGSSGTIAGVDAGAVARKVTPGLVDITSFVHYQQQVFEGTGIVVNTSGLVLTNNHVVKGSTRVVVQLVATGVKYTAQVVGTDNSQDVALLRITAPGLKPVQFGDSNQVKLGTPVVALGNAGGTGGLPTVSQPGTITSLNRTIQASDAGSGTTETLHNMFQSSAPIAEGDSGGALANSAGQVIAMNTAANSQNIGGPGTAQGFSIPINRALSIVQLIAAGKGSGTIQIGQPAFLGIAIASNPGNNQPSTTGSPRAQLRQLEQIARGNFAGINSSGRCLLNETANPVPHSIAPATSGTLIAGVFCNAPAVTAGAAAGDVITAVDGHAVTSPQSLRILMRQYHPGTTVSLTWVGLNGQQRTGSLKLAPGPAA